MLDAADRAADHRVDDNPQYIVLEQDEGAHLREPGALRYGRIRRPGITHR
jgi:hypothetical protein